MILDHEKRLKLPDDIPDKHSNEFRALRSIVEGLCLLNAQVRAIEAHVISNMAKGALTETFAPAMRKGMPTMVTPREQKIGLMGNHPLFKDVPQGLVSCYFHWYSVSACNLVRLVGWIHRQYVDDFPIERDYIDEVIPELKWFRDKIAAHFAKAGGSARDNRAEREHSTMWQLGYSDGVFVASGWTLTLDGSRGTSSSTAPSWSLTQTHDRLVSRYAGPFAERGEFKAEPQV